MIQLPATGYLQVHAYASYAQIPLKDVAVTVTDSLGSAIAMRLTNSSGQLDAPIEIEGLELYKQANYGIVRVNYYRR